MYLIGLVEEIEMIKLILFFGLNLEVKIDLKIDNLLILNNEYIFFSILFCL